MFLARYTDRREKEKAIRHYETALGIASRFDWRGILFWNHHALARLSYNEREFDDATAQIELAKPYTVNEPYNLGRVMELQAQVWYGQFRLKDATLEALHALEIYEKLGAAKGVGNCRDLLEKIGEAGWDPASSSKEAVESQSAGFMVSFW